MKIAFLSNTYSANGGVGTYAVNLHKALQSAGHQSFVIHSDANAAADPASAERNLFYVPEFDLFDWERPVEERTATVMKILAELKPDIVHIQGNNNFVLEKAVRQSYPCLKALHVFDFCPAGTKFHHATQKTCSFATGALCIPRMIYKRCTTGKRPQTIWRLYREASALNQSNRGHSKILVHSEFMRKKAIETGYRPEQISALPYFTDLPHLETLPFSENRIFFNSRIVPEKGLDKLLEAASTLSKFISWKLIIAGDGSYLKTAENLSKSLGLQNRVEFLGWLQPDQMAKQYERATLVAMPSAWPEPFGIVGIEAMSHAKPVIAFRVGGIPEWLLHNHTGILVEPYDLRSLAAGIEMLLKNSAQAKEMGLNGRNNVERLFSTKPHLEKLFAVYKEVIEKSKRRMS